LNLFQFKEEELDSEINAAEMDSFFKKIEAVAATIRAERQGKEMDELFLKVEAPKTDALRRRKIMKERRQPWRR